jgi:hypothetical protein
MVTSPMKYYSILLSCAKPVEEDPFLRTAIAKQARALP